ncbi:hypothetical protein [Blautia sp.]|nr:hypothetical protein [uncultured Blautia sp.]MCQ4866936.1 hypothetical protein [Blautia producta]
MKHGYREVRRISADSLRELCIAKRWYTRGIVENTKIYCTI